PSRGAKGFSRRPKPRTRFTGRFRLRRRQTRRARSARSCSTFLVTGTSTSPPTTTILRASSRMSPWTKARWSVHCARSTACRRPLSCTQLPAVGDACCDPSLSFDNYGNLFLAYLFDVEDTLPIALSTDGGLSFNVIANIPGIAKRNGKGADEKGLFHFVDQPTITAAAGEVWAVV